MSTILITGASGYLGSRLVKTLAGDYPVISLSRRPTALPGQVLTGHFANPNDLSALDDMPFDIVVHLAAVTGGCSEEEAMAVNICGTQRLLRWAADRGVRRIILASSIAAVGCLSRDFMPSELPIADDYPCEAVDPYGMSKAIIEELSAYIHRRLPSIDITLARIGVVMPEDALPVTEATVKSYSVPFAQLASIVTADAIEALAAIVRRPAGPGFHRINLVGTRICSPMPTADTIRLLFGSKASHLNLSYYARAGHEFDPVYTTSRITELFGVRPTIDPATLREVTPL